MLRFFADTSADERLLIVNLGQELNRPSFAAPLLAPPIDFDGATDWDAAASTVWM